MPTKADGSVLEPERGSAPEFDIGKLPEMVRWYSPPLLAETGTRHFISQVFGQFADQRIMQATIDGFTDDALCGVAKRYDYTNRPEFIQDGAFWVDYVADLGDGFDSTYAIASLIAADRLDLPRGVQLPGAKMLLMGGDQVYPFPTRQAYRERLEIPYKLALPASDDPKAAPHHLFVLPGNHDWYDGLNSFDFMFCKARYYGQPKAPLVGPPKENRFGGWLCPQHRSYFALKLPDNWWIWGADIQMSQYLDAGQVLYFREVANQMCSDKTTCHAAKVILCIAEPSWQIPDRQNQQGEGNLDLITEIAVDAGARVCAVIAGDLHHYSRYYAPEIGVNFITTGGGGAYFSPTHWLEDKVELNWSKKKFDLFMTAPENGCPAGSAEACWPSRSESRKMSVDILAFPFRNYWFSVWLGVFYWIMTWQFAGTRVSLRSAATGEHAPTVLEWLTGPDPISGFWEAVSLVVFAGANNFLLGMYGIGFFVVLLYYANAPNSRWLRLMMALLHWSAHILMMITMFVVFMRLNAWIVDKLFPLLSIPITAENRWYTAIRFIALPPPEMIFIGALAAGFVWGLYLTIACLFDRHCDEAFSSMRVDGYKHFLRMKIEPDKLTIYPIGLKDVPSRKDWRKTAPNADGIVRGSLYEPKKPLKPVLIEPPIEIRVGDVKRRDPQAKLG